MAKKVTVIVEKACEKNFTCFMTESVDNWSLVGGGTTAQKAINDIYVAYDEMKACNKEEGLPTQEVEFNFLMDVGSLFDYYPINVSAFAKYIGMNASLLRQYASGAKTPKNKALAKIREGLQKLRNELNAEILIEKPATEYIK